MLSTMCFQLEIIDKTILKVSTCLPSKSIVWLLVLFVSSEQSLRVSSSLTSTSLDWPSDDDFFQPNYYSPLHYTHKSARLRNQLSKLIISPKLTYSLSSPSLLLSDSHPTSDDGSYSSIHNASLEKILNKIDLVSRDCNPNNHHNNNNKSNGKQLQASLSSSSSSDSQIHNQFINLESSVIPLNAVKYRYNLSSSRVELLNAILTDYRPKDDNYRLLRNSFKQMIALDRDIVRARIVWLREDDLAGINERKELKTDYYYLCKKKGLCVESTERSVSINEPWLKLPTEGDQKGHLIKQLFDNRKLPISSEFPESCPKFSNWTIVYHDCESVMWLFSYTSLIIAQSSGSCLLKGFISVDVDINQIDINQCDSSDYYTSNGSYFNNQNVFHVTIPLYGTHKCHRPSSKVSLFNFFNQFYYKQKMKKFLFHPLFPFLFSFSLSIITLFIHFW